MFPDYTDQTDILSDDVNQTGLDPTTGSGTIDWSWLNSIKNFTDVAKNLISPNGPFSAFPLFGLAALANQSKFFNPPPAKVGYQGGIPQFTYAREATPLSMQRPEGYRPGQGGVTYFTGGQYTPTGKDLASPTSGTPTGIVYTPRTVTPTTTPTTTPATTQTTTPSTTTQTTNPSYARLMYEAGRFGNLARDQQADLINDLRTYGYKAQDIDAALSKTPGVDYSGLVGLAAARDLSARYGVAVTKFGRPNASNFNAWTAAAQGAGFGQDVIERARVDAMAYESEERRTIPDQKIDRVAAAASGGYMPGGITMLAQGRYLKGNGDGVSDSIPARFSGSGQEARLADGEFVVPARVVSELGNGSSDAGARKLYAMLDRVEARAKKAKRGKPSGADTELKRLA